MSLSSLYSHILSGSRPEKPADAEAIGISDSLWRLIQKCWGDERTGRPQVQEVVTAVGDAAHNWHIDMPPGVTKYEEDSEGDLDSLEHGEITLFPFPLCYSHRPSVQPGYPNHMKTTSGQSLVRVPTLRSLPSCK